MAYLIASNIFSGNNNSCKSSLLAVIISFMWRLRDVTVTVTVYVYVSGYGKEGISNGNGDVTWW